MTDTFSTPSSLGGWHHDRSSPLLAAACRGQVNPTPAQRPARIAGLVTLLLVIVGAVCAQDAERPNDRDEAFSVTLGAEEHVPFEAIRFCPDEHVSYRKGPRGFSVWVVGEGGNWLFHGPSLARLSRLGQGPVLPSVGNQHFDRDYVGLSAVIPASDGRELLGFYHAEFHPEAPKAFPFLASLGLATSVDGVRWKRVGQVIAGLENQLKPGDGHNIGACEPSAVLHTDGTEEFIYLYWGEYYYDRQGAIYVARSPRASGGRPGTWQKWTGKGWGSPGVQNIAEPVLSAAPSPPYLTLQMPHVSWNTALHRWLMVYASDVAFHAAASADGVHFGAPIEIMRLTPFHGKPGDIFTAYPTLVSPEKATQMVTGEEGFLYFARGPWGTNHTAWRRSFQITVGPPRSTAQSDARPDSRAVR